MTTISKDYKLITFINVFKVQPREGRQAQMTASHRDARSLAPRNSEYPTGACPDVPFSAGAGGPKLWLSTGIHHLFSQYKASAVGPVHH